MPALHPTLDERSSIRPVRRTPAAGPGDALPTLGCMGVSIRHADGVSGCLDDPWCTLPHAAHDWQWSCHDLDGGCLDCGIGTAAA